MQNPAGSARDVVGCWRGGSAGRCGHGASRHRSRGSRAARAADCQGWRCRRSSPTAGYRAVAGPERRSRTRAGSGLKSVWLETCFWREMGLHFAAENAVAFVVHQLPRLRIARRIESVLLFPLSTTGSPGPRVARGAAGGARATRMLPATAAVPSRALSPDDPAPLALRRRSRLHVSQEP